MRGLRFIVGRKPAHGVFEWGWSLERAIVASVGRRPDRFLACRGDVIRAGALQNVLRTGDLLGRVAVYGQQNAALFQSTLVALGFVLRDAHADQRADQPADGSADADAR